MSAEHLPHAPYMEAVRTALSEAGLAPDTTDTAVSDTGLVGWFTWPATHPKVAARRWADGVFLGWATTGWAIADVAAAVSYPMPLAVYADPAGVAEMARLLMADRTRRLPASSRQWEHATATSAAVTRWETTVGPGGTP